MKQKAIPPFTLTAGQCGRLMFNFTLPEGAATPTLRGAVAVSGKKVSMTAVDGGLVIPSLPHGVYLAEVRAGAACVLYGHVEVLPSPLADAEGERGFTVDVDLTTDVLTVNITMAEGLPGAPGKDGASAYTLAVRNGFSGTEEEWLATLKGEPGKSMTVEEVEALLSTSTESLTSSTPVGTDNGTCNYFELDATRSFAGELNAISYRTGSTTATGITTAPIYLAVWELSEGSATEYELAGISSNTITQAINQTLEWQFEGVTLHGRRLRLVPTTDPTVTEPSTSAMLRVRTATSSDGSCCVYNGTSYNFVPQMTLVGTRSVPRFATPADLNEHINDTGKHMAEDERTAWNNAATSIAEHTGDTTNHVSTAQASILSAFEWDANYGLSLIHSNTDGVVDGRLRVLMSATGTNLVTSGSLTLQAAQICMSTRTAFLTWTDSSTGTSYNYGGHTMSGTEMAPYGIAEPCVWYGDPSLPLLLRGSEIRINGTAINVEKLIQLLGNADALLALIAPIDG